VTSETQARSRSRRGFTLIELLIVIAILLAIGGLVVVNLIPRGEKAKTDIQRIQLDLIADALENFRLDLDRWPTQDEGLAVLWSADALEDDEDRGRWGPAYLDAPIQKDRWGNDLIYRFPGEIRGESYYDLVSPGPDGEEGTEDDITNHDRLRTEDGEMPQDIDFGTTDTQEPGAP
jgi:general secretion pathway protein G